MKKKVVIVMTLFALIAILIMPMFANAQFVTIDGIKYRSLTEFKSIKGYGSDTIVGISIQDTTSPIGAAGYAIITNEDTTLMYLNNDTMNMFTTADAWKFTPPLYGFQEGVYYPTITGKGGITTLSDSVCFYQKLGRLVTINCYFNSSDADTGAVNYSVNLPIPCANPPAFSTAQGYTVGGIGELNYGKPINGLYNFTTQRLAVYFYNETANTYIDIRLTFSYTID